MFAVCFSLKNEEERDRAKVRLEQDEGVARPFCGLVRGDKHPSDSEREDRLRTA